MRDKRIGVLGGGLLGCCTALELADRGAHVVVFERSNRLVDGASLHNEGKIHLGYVYAGDPGLETARTMIRGALAFAPFLERHLGVAPERVERSSRFLYSVLRETGRSLDQIAGYLAKVHDLAAEACSGRGSSYFGVDLDEPLRRWSAPEIDGTFNAGRVIAVFETQEIAVDPAALAARIRDRLSAARAVEIRLNRTITSVEDGGAGLTVISGTANGGSRDEFDHVVNALWDRRLGIDASLGIRPTRPWLNRFRYGLKLEDKGALPRAISTTLVHGPFGGIVSYDRGGIYLSWYPACRVESSDRIDPPAWPGVAEEPLRSRVIERTVDALARIVPAVGAIGADRLGRASVIGGNIFAWGSTDTDDPASELHSRRDIGIMSRGPYHSVDPGKLTMAPYFAQLCADRILPP